MRAAPFAAAIVVVLAQLLAAPADARPRKKKVKNDVEDISKVKADLAVLTDEEGEVYVIEDKWGDAHWAFYGDAKVLYRLRVYGGGADGSKGTFDYSFWSPRAQRASIGKNDKGEYFVRCDDGDEGEVSKLTKMSPADAKKLLDTASFRKPLWKRQAQALARDDAGNYYFVDRLRDEHGGKGHRIFAGPKGGMKELPMTNVVSDSVGEIYATRKGELRFITDPNKATWIRGTTKTELTIIPLEMNIAMIYGELGVYDGSLGTPCDDM